MQESFLPTMGQRVRHSEFGEGVVSGLAHGDYVTVFFASGERTVHKNALEAAQSRSEKILSSVSADKEKLSRVWLALEAYSIPLMDSAAALTAARIDLLPHQVVLTHRIACAFPRRFLIADEVGLGKTIEAALVLRELASRGELERALMIVPAGLVNNWHRELNDVFNLNFEVFGSEGDVTDRKTNAFAKHNRLIASIDTLKRPARVKRILDAQKWDLVVFDEAHHLTATRAGNKPKKTENYKLAEALRDRARDLVLLSATPHQGDHYRFWMLIQLLRPGLFRDYQDMIENRHRLNEVVFRRTKADACKVDGSSLFARRSVHTESFLMNPDEKAFYDVLREYLDDGFELAKKQGSEGRALGFVMAVFQKIAASSFFAVKKTLRKRLLSLTIHEAILKDQELDVEGREALFSEARSIIHEDWALLEDLSGRSEADRILADIKIQVIKKIEADIDLSEDEYTAASEEDVALSISLALPEERLRIKSLLNTFPNGNETKIQSLIHALGVLWRADPTEKIVIFATYLGTVDLIGEAIDSAYPGQGVVVLRGGDHGSKLAAEKRFRMNDGPRVIVCTAAGREGINLQFARVLFNFDLPWNPMDLEQRIGRIHRYGQKDTAQVYNLVLSDTIEGRIFLLLEDKLNEIVKTLGKVDEKGIVAEDLRSQILGQLSEKLNYERLFQDAISDPQLQRTRLEVDAALSNAKEAREVVFNLFQDLERFSLDDYRAFSDVQTGLDRLTRFLQIALPLQKRRIAVGAEGQVSIGDEGGNSETLFTTNREVASSNDKLQLLGIDHPLVLDQFGFWQNQEPEFLAVSVKSNSVEKSGVVTSWIIGTRKQSSSSQHIITLGASLDGSRQPMMERQLDLILTAEPFNPLLSEIERRDLLHGHIEPMLLRELQHRGLVHNEAEFSAKMVCWIEVHSS
jgi:SNF2 family DNA or RNA helicase